MPNRLTRILVLLAAAAIAFVGVVLAAALLLPTERVAALAARRAEAAIGREVRIDRIALDLFPAPAVALEGVAVGRSASAAAGADGGERATTAGAPLATVRRVLLRPRLLPLLRRQVLVDAVVLERPLLLIEVDSAGDRELPGAGDADAPAEDGGADIAFAVRRLEIEDGRLAYVERSSGTAVRLDGVNQRLELSGAIQDGELVRIETSGELEVAALDATLPGELAVPLRGVRLRVEHDGVLDRTTDRLAVERLVVRLGDVELEGGGTVSALSDAEAREVDLRLATGPVELAEVAGPLASALAEPDTTRATEAALPDIAGRVRVRATVNGRLGAGVVPDVRGTAMLEDVSVAHAGVEGVVAGVGGEIAFSLDSLRSDGLAGELLGEPLRLAFTVRDLAAPVAQATVDAALDLARADALGLLPDSVDMRGRATIDLAVRTPLLDPAGAQLEGAIGLTGIALESAAVLQPVRVEAGRVLLRGQELRGDGVELRLGESDLVVDFAVRDWLARALGDSSAVPSATFDARSRLLDADALLGIDSVSYAPVLFARLADRPIDGRPAAEHAQAAGIAMPALPPLELDGRFRAAVLRRNGLELRDVDVALAGGAGGLEVRDARFGLMGGTVRVAATIGAPLPAAAAADDVVYPTAIRFQLQDLGASTFFDTFTPFRDHLTGSLALAGTATMLLDAHMLPVRETVAAEGTIAVGGGRLANWTVLRALSGELGLASFDTLRFRDWTGGFDIAGPSVTIEESRLDSDELEARVAGSFDFGGRLDLGATLYLSRELAARTGQSVARRLADAAAGGTGRIPVGAQISGPAERPSIRLDFSEAAENAAALARQKAEAEARALAERAAAEALQRLAPGDSAAQNPLDIGVDSARQRIETELRDRLRGLIRRP